MHNKETDMDKQDQKILALLKDYPMPEATAGYFDQALVRATHEGSRRQRNRWRTLDDRWIFPHSA